MIILKKFSIKYDNNIIIKPWDFNSNLQDKIVITGCSGSGKSSILHMLAGLQSGYDGQVIWSGKPLSKMSNSQKLAWRRQNIGFVFQHHHLLQDFSILENVMLPCILNDSSVAVAKEKSEQLLTSLGLKSVINSSIDNLSGGERQRVAIARAIVHQPKVILADEPTGALDPKTAENTLSVLFEFAKNSSIILVTHNTDIAAKFARHIEIKEGECIER